MYRDRESKNTYAIALTILIISNICFYTMEHLKLYLLLTMIGLIIEFYEIIRKLISEGFQFIHALYGWVLYILFLQLMEFLE